MHKLKALHTAVLCRVEGDNQMVVSEPVVQPQASEQESEKDNEEEELNYLEFCERNKERRDKDKEIRDKESIQQQSKFFMEHVEDHKYYSDTFKCHMERHCLTLVQFLSSESGQAVMEKVQNILSSLSPEDAKSKGLYIYRFQLAETLTQMKTAVLGISLKERTAENLTPGELYQIAKDGETTVKRLFDQGCLNHIFLEHSILANVILQHEQIEAFVKALGDIIDQNSQGRRAGVEVLNEATFRKYLKNKSVDLNVLAASPLWGEMVKEKKILNKLQQNWFNYDCEMRKIYNLVAKASPESNHLNSSSTSVQNDPHSVHLLVQTLLDLPSSLKGSLTMSQLDKLLKDQNVSEKHFALEVMPKHSFLCLAPDVKEHFERILEEKKEQERIEQERVEALAKQQREMMEKIETNRQAALARLAISKRVVTPLENTIVNYFPQTKNTMPSEQNNTSSQKKRSLEESGSASGDGGYSQSSLNHEKKKVGAGMMADCDGEGGFISGGSNAKETDNQNLDGKVCATCGGPAQIYATDFDHATDFKYSCWTCQTKEH